jgi:HD-GYP domain-containing protein (c-di-GMP phosphodiesterase class II)
MHYNLSENIEIDSLLNHIVSDIANFAHKQDKHIHEMHMIGTALSAETNLSKLLDMILVHAIENSNCDGGTIYMMSKDETSLEFKVVKNNSLKIHMGGVKEKITWPNLNLYNDDESENFSMVAAKCALSGDIINIEDVYKNEDGFNFEGTKKFDKNTGYHSKSMLVIPMKNHENEVIGVVQLINHIDERTKEISKFHNVHEEALSALASQAAVAITNVQLIYDLRFLLESFIKSIATAIDEKSPYTGGHVRKVAEITMIIVHALNEADDGKYKDIHYNEDQLNELRIAALMHDIGKITTPEYVVDKSNKLETIVDRIELIRDRLEIIKRDIEISFLKNEISAEEAKLQQEQLENDFKFLEDSNIGGEFMSDDKIERLVTLSKKFYFENGKKMPLINEDELKNLSIRKGTLTEDERHIINNHAKVSLDMLHALPFPKKLNRVPEIAGGHHEKLNGKGYPLGLTADELTLESRVLALADIFEALTASDRPYKDAKTLSESMRIINFMVKDEELDGDLIQFFIDKKLHLKYANQELKEEQIDM